VNRSGIVDGILVAVGVFLLLQTAGSIIGIVQDYQDNPILFTMAFLPVLLGAGATWCLRKAYYRRKKRKSEEQAREQTPIGIRTISVQKQKGRPAGVTLIGAVLVISAIFLVIEGPLELFQPESALNLPSDLLRALGVVDLVDGITSFIVAFGIFTAKKWAWKWGIIEMYATIGLGIMDVLLVRPGLSGYVSLAIITPIMIAMVYYFYRPHIRAYFGRTAVA
jgi:divalent metal cation (Fe/Co/Zn/Cd) transporter